MIGENKIGEREEDEVKHDNNERYNVNSEKNHPEAEIKTRDCSLKISSKSCEYSS